MTAATRSARAANLAIQVAWMWSVYVTLKGIYWSAGGAGYPFGHDDPTAPDHMSILVSMDASAGGRRSPRPALPGSRWCGCWSAGSPGPSAGARH